MSANDWTTPSEEGEDEESTGADGWVETTAPDERPEAPSLDLEGEPDRPPALRDEARPDCAPDDDRLETSETWRDGQTMAIFAHMSVLFGIPVFLVPLLLRNDPLSVHHAKAAAVTFAGFYAGLVLAFVSVGLFMPIAMLFYIPALVGIARAVQGRRAGTWGFGEIGERLLPPSDDESDA